MHLTIKWLPLLTGGFSCSRYISLSRFAATRCKIGNVHPALYQILALNLLFMTLHGIFRQPPACGFGISDWLTVSWILQQPINCRVKLLGRTSVDRIRCLPYWLKLESDRFFLTWHRTKLISLIKLTSRAFPVACKEIGIHLYKSCFSAYSFGQPDPR